MNEQEWRFLIAGSSGDVEVPANPTKWIDDLTWIQMYREVYGMAQLDAFKGFETYFFASVEKFKSIYDSNKAHEEPLPEKWNNLNSFQKMLVLKAIRPDMIIPAIQNWITEEMGKEFIDPPPFKLASCFKDSSIMTPLIFVLSAGSDPVADFQRFAEEMGMSKRMDSISLGQGQGDKAKRLIEDASQRGGWVLLQNCHLSISWMPELERITEEFNDSMHPEFRMWLTSMPSPHFPTSVLQNGIKMTIEPPKGLRSNMLRSYNNMDNKELNDCSKPDSFKKMLFGFCFFHAIVQDRRKFGPIGWNIPYEFTNEDLAVSKRQLKLFLDEYDYVPYKVLNFIVGEINYGGRVTDDKDVRLIRTILRTYIRQEILEDNHKFSSSGMYYSLKAGEQEDYLEYIRGLPLNPAPEAFGLHENAQITTAQSETEDLLLTILTIQPRSTSGGGKTREEVISEMAAGIEAKTPAPFDIEEAGKAYPTQYSESMNTVLIQEIIRYNKLLILMKDTLKDVQLALVGRIVMSEELEKLANYLYDNLVPTMWSEVGFLSMKPLSSWVKDLNDRIHFLQEWYENGTPKIYWISGFFFPQAFITGTLQNYARKHVVAIDRLSFKFNILDDLAVDEIHEKPADGCYVYGMFMEGARWDTKIHAIADSNPKELYTELPVIHMEPVPDRVAPETGIYDCPVYKVLSRLGTLSTTGHSTNFVMYMEIPSQEEQDVWIKAGVAIFLALKY
mmetsp:Transcript_23005/g.26017  ORF Transcript_23005/g.26017 Transcript_23005/m.26017 type:complete len:729 (+) Transcript_23005:3-2189(+)